MSDAPTGAPQQRYRLAMYGGGIEELDRFAVRDRIRSGEIESHTELAITGTEDWKAAADFPELARYFSLASVRPVTSAGPIVQRKTPREVRPMGERVIQGLLYPLAGGEVMMLIGLAVLSIVPVFGRLAPLAASVIMVGIVRASADGKLKLPLIDTSNVWELIRTSLRVFFITLVSLAPFVVVGFLSIGGAMTGKISAATGLLMMTAALAISALYYPACLATVAVWDNILASLNPMYVIRVIRIIGADYFIVVGMWFVATFGTALIQSPIVGYIPIFGTIFKSAVSYWVLFYASHLLGYAVYRHLPELGWE